MNGIKILLHTEKQAMPPAREVPRDSPPRNTNAWSCGEPESCREARLPHRPKIQYREAFFRGSANAFSLPCAYRRRKGTTRSPKVPKARSENTLSFLLLKRHKCFLGDLYRLGNILIGKCRVDKVVVVVGEEHPTFYTLSNPFLV